MKKFAILALVATSLVASPALAQADALSVRASAPMEAESNLAGAVTGWLALAALVAVVIGAIELTGDSDGDPVSP